jgi:hypothetical protein
MTCCRAEVGRACLALPRRGLCAAERGVEYRLQCHRRAFRCRVCVATEMGRSSARIPRQNLFNFCSERAWVGGVGPPESNKGAWLTEQPRVMYSASWRRPGLRSKKRGWLTRFRRLVRDYEERLDVSEAHDLRGDGQPAPAQSHPPVTFSNGLYEAGRTNKIILNDHSLNAICVLWRDHGNSIRTRR